MKKEGKILLYSITKFQKFLIIINSFFTVIVLNCFLQPLLEHFSIDEFFFRSYPYIFALYLIVLAILCYFIIYFFYRMLDKYYFKREKQIVQKLTQIKSMEGYTDRIEDLYLDIRSFKHDYINILSSFHTYINEHNYEGLEKYFKQEILPTGSKMAFEDSVYGKLGFVQVPEIKSIVYTKILYAMEQKISVTTDIKEKFNGFPMNTLDLVRVLGILLDNAIEASASTNEKILCITFFKDLESICIQIKNSSSQIENIEKLYQVGTSSKGEGRGIGLYEVRKILNQYSNVLLNTEYNDFIFSQKLVILYM